MACVPKFWDVAKGKAYERSPLAKELNMYLDSIRAKLIRIHRDMEQDDTLYITADAVIKRLSGKDKPERHTIMEVFHEHNDRCRKLSGIDMSPATVERYETCLKHTQEFMQHTYRRDDFFLVEINRQFIEDYELYLKTVRTCNHNSTTRYLSVGFNVYYIKAHCLFSLILLYLNHFFSAKCVMFVMEYIS